MADNFDRITFIHPDGDDEETVGIDSGVVFEHNGHRCIGIEFKEAVMKTPDWADEEMDVVAATSDGDVVEAFSVRSLTNQASVPPHKQTTKDLPAGTFRLFSPQ